MYSDRTSGKGSEGCSNRPQRHSGQRPKRNGNPVGTAVHSEITRGRKILPSSKDATRWDTRNTKAIDR